MNKNAWLTAIDGQPTNLVTPKVILRFQWWRLERKIKGDMSISIIVLWANSFYVSER